MLKTPFDNIDEIDDETITLFELREIFEEIEKGTIKNISYGKYNHHTQSIDHKSFEISKIIRCKNCGRRYANGCPFYMAMIETKDDFFCGDAKQNEKGL